MTVDPAQCVRFSESSSAETAAEAKWLLSSLRPTLIFNLWIAQILPILGGAVELLEQVDDLCVNFLCLRGNEI